MTAAELKNAFWGKIHACKTAAELQALAYASPAAHMACFVQVLNKEGELEILKPNTLQLRMSQIYETCAALALPCRMVVCKIRQCGGTEMGLQIGYHHSMKRRVRAIAISDKRPNSKKLVKRLAARRRTDTFPWGIRLREVQEEVFFSNESYWEIESAENHKAGIGDTRQFALFSEVAKWPKTTVVNDESIMGAVMPSIAKTGFSCAVAESTPDGANGWHYTKYTKEAVSFEEFLARVARGERPIVWIKVFAGWYEFEENRLSHLTGAPPAPAQIAEMKRSLSPREHAGMRQYAWDWDQVAWRRAMISMDCNGDEDIFDAYYPEDDVRCLGAENRIPTLRGLVKISDVQVGDTLANGTVLNAWQSGFKRVHELTTACGFRVACTPDHRIALAGGGFVEARDSIGCDVRVSPPVFATNPAVVRWTGFAGVRCEIKITPQWGRFLGYYAGDGSFYKNQLSMVCDAKDADLIGLLARDWEDLLGTSPTLRTPGKAKAVELRGYDVRLREVFDNLDLLEVGEYGLRRKIGVPEPIWRSPKEVVREFLSGLFEADGHVRRTGRAIQFHSKHKRFCQDVLLLLLGFGVRAKLGPVSATLKGKVYPGWRLIIYAGYVANFYDEIGFLSERKQSFAELARTSPTAGRQVEILEDRDTVVSFSAEGTDQPVWDLTMSNDPEFSAGGVIVHNCWAVSGRPRFNMQMLMTLERRISSRRMHAGYLTIQTSDEVTFAIDPEGGGDILLWEEPLRGCRYLVACDPATGASNTHGADPDRNSVQVWRQGYADETGMWINAALVARVRSPNTSDGDDVAMAIVKLSRYFGNCLVVLEVNQGIHVLDHLTDAGVPLFRRAVPSLRPGVALEQFGFKLTDQEQRRQVIEGLAAAIREGQIDVWDQNWIDEAKTFITTPGGRYEARPGCHDDDTMCFPAGALVRCVDGWKPIEQVAVGDLVLTHQGRYMPVGRTMAREVAETVEVDIFGRLPLRITSNHPLLVRERYHRTTRSGGRKTFGLCHRDLEWRSADDGLEAHASVGSWNRDVIDVAAVEIEPCGSFSKMGEKLVATTYGGQRLNPKAAVVDPHVEVDDEFCWILGYYYAEGGHGAHSVAFAAHRRERPYLERVAAWFSARGFKPSIRKTSENGIQLTFGSTVWRGWFRKHFGVGREKTFPRWVESLPIEKQRRVLAGWACGDAAFVNSGLRGVTISKVGAFQLWEMFCRCGFPASIRYVKNPGGYCIALGGPAAERFMKEVMADLMAVRLNTLPKVKKDQANIRIVDGEILGKIRSVRRIESPVTVYNLTVVGDSSYVVEGTVVHNCGAMAWLALPGATEYRGPIRRRKGPPDRKDWRRFRGAATQWR